MAYNGRSSCLVISGYGIKIYTFTNDYGRELCTHVFHFGSESCTFSSTKNVQSEFLWNDILFCLFDECELEWMLF